MLRQTCVRLIDAARVYELRTMRIRPGDYARFQELATTALPKRPAHGKLLGYWTAQLGALNEFFQIWQYDNLAHRYQCRKLLESNPEWDRTFLQPSRTMMDSQTNELMRLVFLEPNASTQSYKYLLQFSPELDIEPAGPSAILAASFQVTIGPHEGKYLHLIKSRRLDDLMPSTPTVGKASAIVGPARWSSSMGALWR